MEKFWKKSGDSGFIGLIVLMISVAIIALLVIRTDLFQGNLAGGKGNQTEGIEPLRGNNMIEQGISAIDKAKKAKALLEQNDRKLMDEPANQ